LLGRIFRAFHTTKGVAGFLNFSKLEALTHAAEGLLSRLRDRELIFDSSIASALLNSVDAVRRMLASIESNGTDGEFDYADLIRSLTSLTEGAAQPPDDAVAEGVLAGNQSETVQSLDGAGSAHHADVTAQSVSAPVDQGRNSSADGRGELRSAAKRTHCRPGEPGFRRARRWHAARCREHDPGQRASAR
jgi:two-component system chemotaxis sensor kinase CheA